MCIRDSYTPLKKVYEFNPIPDELDAAQANYILGGQANLWTEYIRDFKQLEYMAYPRAIALSQVLWCNEKIEFNDFCKILYDSHYKKLALLDVNYSKSSQRASIKSEVNPKGISLKLNSPDTSDIFYTTIHSKSLEEVLKLNLRVGEEIIIKRPEKQIIETKIKFESKNTSLISELDINRHLALGGNVNYITKPNPQYNYTPSLLVDGQNGARPWRGHEWIGFDTSSIIMEITLPEERRVKKIEFSFLESNGSWIYLPQEILVSKVSKRQKKIRTQRNIDTERTSLKIKKRIKTVRIQINTFSKLPKGLPGAGHTPSTFLDEIVFH